MSTARAETMTEPGPRPAGAARVDRDAALLDGLRRGDAGAAELLLDSGETWRLQAKGATLSIEDSTYFADAAGTRPAQQVVLRAQCYGASEVSWVIERVGVAHAAENPSAEARGLVERLAETSAGFEGAASRREPP